MIMCDNIRKNKTGQVIIFLVLMLVILFFVVIFNFDLHKILYIKSLSQNAGDASALMAARWQGITLNLIGDLNIMQALALSQGDTVASSAITGCQARLCFSGPMIAFMTAQTAAKNNRAYRNPDFDDVIREHAWVVRHVYPVATGPDGKMLFPEPYAGAWSEYANMLDYIATEGIAAAPDNARFYTDYTGGHFLLMIDFYEAIAGKNWCWFYFHAGGIEPDGLLKSYTDYHWWPPLPEIPHHEYVNSEIFGLALTKRITTLSSIISPSTVSNAAVERGLGEFGTNNIEVETAWYCYDSGSWSKWAKFEDPFPAVGPVKPQYDYVGADAVVRLYSSVKRLTPGPENSFVTNTVVWTAAAKPFGYLAENDKPNSYGLVLPAFRQVALIPIDTSTAPSGGAFNLAWRIHIEKHLPEYLERGPRPSSCWYCRQLLTWEVKAFRDEGIAWLEQNSWRCTIGGGGGGGGDGGGSHIGH